MTPIEELIKEQFIKDEIMFGDFYIDDSYQAVMDSILEVVNQQIETKVKEAVIKTYRHVELGGNTTSVANHERIIERAEQYYNSEFKQKKG